MYPLGTLMHATPSLLLNVKPHTLCAGGNNSPEPHILLKWHQDHSILRGEVVNDTAQ